MKAKATWWKCNGEAHSNPYIDNCGVCAPWWGNVPLCPTCEKKLTWAGYCTRCKKYFDFK